jgi:hypothetical protein
MKRGITEAEIQTRIRSCITPIATAGAPSIVDTHLLNFLVYVKNVGLSVIFVFNQFDTK